MDFAKRGPPPHLGAMVYLLLASLLWAFSFGLIKGQLAGLDPGFVALVRLALAALAFAPLSLSPTARRKGEGAGVSGRSRLWLPLGLGALQFGLMYVLYIASFAFLPAWMVALFTIMTPVYVVLLAPRQGRRFALRAWGAAALAVLGAAVVLAKGMPAGADWRGILLLQGANLCFAAGQIWYPRVRRGSGLGDGPLLGHMYVGGALVPAVWMLARAGEGLSLPATTQLGVLLYLGLAPTALGFYLWNKGAARVSPGVLAGANNLKVPLAVVVSWLVFGEAADYLRVSLGLALVVAGLFLAGARGQKKG